MKINKRAALKTLLTLLALAAFAMLVFLIVEVPAAGIGFVIGFLIVCIYCYWLADESYK